MRNYSRLKIVVTIFLLLSLLISPVNALKNNNSQIYAEENNNKSVEKFSSGIDGAITADTGYYKLDGTSETIILPTQYGIYLVKENKAELFIETEGAVTDFGVVPDIDNDGKADIVAVIKTDVFPNIRAYSTGTGNMLWNIGSSEDYFNEIYSFVDKRNLPINSLSVIGYESGESQIILVSNYDVIALSHKDGSESWRYEDENNVWDVCEVKDINGNNFNDIVFGNQLGEVKAIDGKTGKIIWENKIVSDFDVVDKMNDEELGTVTRSVWDIVAKEDSESVLVTAEDGVLYNIGLTDGTVINKTDIEAIDEVKLNQFYVDRNQSSGMGYYPSSEISPIGIMDAAFFKYKIFDAGDLTNDGKSDYVVTQDLGFDLSYTQFTNLNKQITDDKKIKVMMVDGQSLEVKWEKDLSDIVKNFEHLEPIIRKIDNKNYIFLPNEISNGKLSIVALETTDGGLAEEHFAEIELPQVSSSFYDSNQNYYNDPNYYGEYVVEQEKIIVDKAPTQTAELQKCRFVFDKSEDGQYFIGLIDYFSFEVDESLKSVTNNLNTLFQGSAVNFNDDILCFYESNGSYTAVALYDEAKNEVWRFEGPDTGIEGVTNFSQVAPTKDVNNDGKMDLVLSGKYGDNELGNIYRVFVVSGQDGKLLSETFVPEVNGNVFEISDANGDGITDFVVFSDKSLYKLLSNVNAEKISFTKDSAFLEYSEGSMNNNFASVIGDINNDGTKDFYLMGEPTSATVKVYSGKDTVLLYEIKDYANSEIYFSKNDFNNDGVNDYVKYNIYELSYKIISGKDGSEIFTVPGPYSDMNNQDYGKPMPAFPDEQVEPSMFVGRMFEVVFPVTINENGESKAYYVVSSNVASGWRTMNQLQLYDANSVSSTPVKTFILPLEDKYRSYYDRVELIPLQGENAGDLILVKSNEQTLLFNLKEWIPICTFDSGKIDSARIDGNILTIVGSEYKRINVDNDYLNISLEGNVNSPIDLKWSEDSKSDFSMMGIFVDGIYSAVSYDNNYKLKVSEGEHIITLKHTNNFGVSYYETLNVNVSKSKLPSMLLIITCSVALLVLFILIKGPSLRRKRILKNRKV